ncbi:unnamed protein product [Adineta steineri]|uniref:Uncharacterized protein n=1 Tax=Adineta steineri TaxID=433720 RepID=A0A815LQN6_9BILA|nr:unnamed protein product [Adineta steineri]CAF1616420.1 unnamed protein product [Adineta steineri]
MFSCSCDTMVVMSDITDDGSIIFGKNSDRQTNEPLSTRYIPSSINSLNSKVKATHIEIHQVEKTYSCILFSPTNIFGAEMGFNCHGLVVGNEALFTKIPSYNDGLTGMDLVRLVLERCSTSREGKNEIISLINKYGQGGNCGFTSKFYYHSSFLLVDSHEGWIIETVGKEYAAKRITKGIHTISNIISFGNLDTFDEYSENLIQQAISKGWCHSKEDFHFQKCYSGLSFYPQEFYNGFLKTNLSCGHNRQIRSKELINKKSQFNVIDMFNILRDHQYSKSKLSDGLTDINICMHASFGPIRFNQTTGSLVSVIPTVKNQIPTHYATCTSLPCLSIFKPIWLDSTIKPPTFISSLDKNKNISNASFTYSSNNIWWKSEIITRNVMKYYQKLIKQIEIERDLLENNFVSKSKQLSLENLSQKERNQYTINSFNKVDQLTTEWLSRTESLSFEMKSELSLCQELTWEKWRIFAKIPNELLTYSKAEYFKKLLLLISLLLILILLWIFLFKQIDQQYFMICLSFIIYFFIIQIFMNKTTNTKINLLLLNFNEQD